MNINNAFPSALSSGLQSMANAQNKVNASAQQIADVTAGKSGDLTGALVQLKQGEVEAQVAARVMSTHNSLLGSLLDIKV